MEGIPKAEPTGKNESVTGKSNPESRQIFTYYFLRLKNKSSRRIKH